MKIIAVILIFEVFEVKSDLLTKTVDLVTGIEKKEIDIVEDVATSSKNIFDIFSLGCDKDVTMDYRRAIYDFNVRLFKEIAAENNDNVAISQYSIWLAMAAIAEGNNDLNLFELLNLPDTECLRQKYYEIATQLETSAEDVNITRRRVLIIDNSLKLNMTWASYVRSSGLIDTRSVQLKGNPKAIADIANVDVAKIRVDDSVLLDTLDFKGLWTTGFNDALTERDAPFYNDDGENIGTVDLLRIKKRVKLAYLPILHAKVLELPIGNAGRYRFLIMINLGKNQLRRTIQMLPNTIIIDIMENLVESLIPLDIAIPKFNVSSQIDVRSALEKLGFNLWNNTEATKHITQPPATLSINQRVSLQFNNAGLSTNLPSSLQMLPVIGPIATALDQAATGLAVALDRQFIANRPFVYAFVDSVTRTSLFTGAYSVPRK